jgi:hypothetical protein
MKGDNMLHKFYSYKTSTRRRISKAFAEAAACLLAVTVSISTISNRATSTSASPAVMVNASTGTAPGTAIPDPQSPYIYWTFGEIRRGDCTLSPGGTFYLYADGSTRWVCDLRSSDSGDEWDGHFEITNANGQVLAATPSYHFDISLQNVTRHWDDSRGSNASLAVAYAQARGINFFCSC